MKKLFNLLFMFSMLFALTSMVSFETDRSPEPDNKEQVQSADLLHEANADDCRVCWEDGDSPNLAEKPKIRVKTGDEDEEKEEEPEQRLANLHINPGLNSSYSEYNLNLKQLQNFQYGIDLIRPGWQRAIV